MKEIVKHCVIKAICFAEKKNISFERFKKLTNFLGCFSFPTLIINYRTENVNSTPTVFTSR